MRIIWLSHLLPYPPKGGVQQRSFNLLKEVAKRHEVHLLAFNQNALLPETDINTAVSELSTHCRVLEVLPIPSDRSKSAKRALALRSLWRTDPYTVNWLQSSAFAEAVSRHASRLRYDFVHCDTISLAPYRATLGQIPASLTHHNIESDMLLRRASMEPNAVKRAYYWQEGHRLRRYERQTAGAFEVHLTCSNLDADRLRDIAPGIRTEVIPNGVDTQYFDPRLFPNPRKPDSLVFAGGLAWYPNASAMRFFFDRIWRELKVAHPAASITVIGRRPPAWLSRFAATDASVAVTGFVDDVRPYLATAQVYVCPIFDGGGTKLKVLDALAMGIPLVAHPTACEGIDVLHERHVLLASTPQEFIKAIGRLFTNPELRLRLATAGRELATSRYDFRSIGGRLADLYEALVNK